MLCGDTRTHRRPLPSQTPPWKPEGPFGGNLDRDCSVRGVGRLSSLVLGWAEEQTPEGKSATRTLRSSAHTARDTGPRYNYRLR
jgi:hypothetical protein